MFNAEYLTPVREYAATGYLGDQQQLPLCICRGVRSGRGRRGRRREKKKRVWGWVKGNGRGVGPGREQKMGEEVSAPITTVIQESLDYT